MGSASLAVLWAEPEINPISRKARSLPILNPVNIYGRTYWLSAVGFCVAFWAWYAIPPLLTVTLSRDLDLTPLQVANSNIVSLVATLCLRALSGPLCDQFGPRRVFAALLFLGSIPVGLTPLVTGPAGLYAVRFFTGLLGATFVPCQVWCTAFFDKNIVGTANGLAAGWGNAGGGLTYLIIPAVLDSLLGRGMSDHQAWRVTFVVPLICLLAVAGLVLLVGHDTPVGKWHELEPGVRGNLASHSPAAAAAAAAGSGGSEGTRLTSDEKPIREASIDRDEARRIATTETVRKNLTLQDTVWVVLSLQTLFLVATYGCSFGGELAIDAVLAKYYYTRDLPRLTQAQASNYASVFGFLNLVTRPLGGAISDLLYAQCGAAGLWAKKLWISACGIAAGALLIIIGRLDIGRDIGSLVGLFAAAAFFMEAGNGANFSLVPHVHPHANGIISGLTGAGGNAGGVIFAILFRFVRPGSNNYGSVIYIMGLATIAVNVALVWVRPLPKGQVGGR